MLIQNILLKDIEKRLSADLESIGIDTSKSISIKIDYKKDVTVTGLTEEENVQAANLIKEKYSDWLYNSYLHNSENVKAMNDNIVPPTINLDNQDPEVANLDYVPHKAIEQNVDIALTNSFGFGGHNGIVVFKKVSE